jgi:hypothetical protein
MCKALLISPGLLMVGVRHRRPQTDYFLGLARAAKPPAQEQEKRQEGLRPSIPAPVNPKKGFRADARASKSPTFIPQIFIVGSHCFAIFGRSHSL